MRIEFFILVILVFSVLVYYKKRQLNKEWKQV